MALVYKDRVKQVCSAPTTTDPFDFTGAATTTGYQTFVAALADGETCVYAAEDADGDWEVGIGTWTEASDQLARTTILASSNAGSAETFSGDVTVYITADASRTQSSYEAHSAVIPGGRLTLESGVPVSSTDQTAKTSVYYTPYVHDRISLWTGNYWKTIQFTEYTLALGTVTSGKPYDVFAYLNSGALALEQLVWTDDTTRATAITLQDGRYCKSGDKTRLYLGTFYTTSTTATADSLLTRYLWNAYNRTYRRARVAYSASSHTYNSTTVRYWNNDSANKIQFVIGFAQDLIMAIYGGQTNYGIIGIWPLDTESGSRAVGFGTYASASSAGGVSTTFTAGAGRHFVGANEVEAAGSQTSTYYDFELIGVFEC